ncbi:DnaJ-domain-containing protein [Dacryopinax primogenitus]|uniref:DnaJ-domain-containing protein n=1 Tax=Dacryopinax primogenitus (strain DJM 731) TaxID=1858805 RepID=M5GCL6_DACPD|nr:DnaJ-domain-containing protein [Dacryopinax primogenitus]EJU03947.1 DnaJ-domain-containing protein [Dacryopinax primogenitus]
MLRATVCCRSSANAFRSFSTSLVTRAATLDLSYPSHGHPTPYEIFHLPRTATQDEIKERYYELVRLHHPDSPVCRHEPDNVRQERFKAIAKAYEILKSNRNPAYLKELHRRQTQHGYPNYNPTRRQQYAYHSLEEGSMDVGNGDVFFVVTILAILGSVVLIYSPFSAKERLDAHHASASHALAEARREAKELSVHRRKNLRKWIEEAGLEGVTPNVGHGSARRQTPSSNN